MLIVRGVKAPETEAAAEDSGLSGIAASFNKTFVREDRWKLFVEGVLTTDTVQFSTLYLLTPSPSPRTPHPHPGGYRGCCKVATITARITAKSQKRSTLAPHLAPIS